MSLAFEALRVISQVATGELKFMLRLAFGKPSIRVMYSRGAYNVIVNTRIVMTVHINTQITISYRAYLPSRDPYGCAYDTYHSTDECPSELRLPIYGARCNMLNAIVNDLGTHMLNLESVDHGLTSLMAFECGRQLHPSLEGWLSKDIED